MKNEPLYECYLTGDTQLHIQTKNSKLGNGIHNISLLPGDKPLTLNDGTILTNIPGTCHGCCKDCKHKCYAVNYTKCNHLTCVPAYNDNTVMALNDPERYFRRIQDYLNDSVVGVWRWHVAGEIPNYDYLKRMNKLAGDNPDTKFYFYTKRYKWLEKLADNHEMPDNFIPTVSIWHNNYSNPFGFNEYIYDDHVDKRLETMIHCPAEDKKGRKTGQTCARCKRCFSQNKGLVTAVYAH